MITLKLRTRFSLVLAGFALAVTTTAALLSSAILLNAARRVDNDRATEILDRANDMLLDDGSSLLRLATDWASWDDSYAFMDDRNQGYIDANLVESTFHELRIDALLYIGTNRQPVAAYSIDPDGRFKPDVAKELRTVIFQPEGLLDRTLRTSRLSGLLAIDDEIWLAAASPVLTSHDEGPSRGTLLMLRHINASKADRWARLIHPSIVVQAIKHPWTSHPMEVHSDLPSDLRVRRRIADVLGEERINIQITLPRDASGQVAFGMLNLTGWIMVCGIAVTLFAFGVLDRWVLRSVSESVAALRKGTSTVAGRNAWKPLRKIHADEIGELIDTVNTTLTAFENSNKSLAASEARYRVLVQTMPEAIAGLDREGRLLFGNPAFRRMVAPVSVSELKGQLLSELLDPSLATSLVTHCPQVGDTDPVEIGPIEATVTGGTRFVTAILTAVGADGDIAPYTLLCIRDVTAKLLAEREADHRRKQAVQAQKLAAVGTLVAGVAHEVNNPNGIVHFNMKVLQKALGRLVSRLAVEINTDSGHDQDSDPGSIAREMDEVIEETLSASKRIADIVALLTRFAQPSTDRPRESVHLHQLAQNAAHCIRHLLREQNCRLVTCVPSSLPPVYGHSQQLLQVFINLLQNAVEASTQAHARITVSAQATPDRRTVMITVADQGNGIPEQNLDSVLDPFFTTRRDSGGTGLGLSISAAIVKAHGGQIQIASAINMGTTVTITLPTNESRPNDDLIRQSH